MKSKYFLLIKLAYFLPFIFVLNCTSSETMQDNKDIEFPVKLSIINSNGRNFNPAHIKVTLFGIKGREEIFNKIIVEEDFTENGGHNWKPFNISVKQGNYTLLVECKNDNSKMSVSFEVDKPLWLLLSYQENNHFSLDIRSRGFVLG